MRKERFGVDLGSRCLPCSPRLNTNAPNGQFVILAVEDPPSHDAKPPLIVVRHPWPRPYPNRTPHLQGERNLRPPFSRGRESLRLDPTPPSNIPLPSPLLSRRSPPHQAHRPPTPFPCAIQAREQHPPSASHRLGSFLMQAACPCSPPVLVACRPWRRRRRRRGAWRARPGTVQAWMRLFRFRFVDGPNFVPPSAPRG